jgi:hypothetical protein
MPHSFLYIREHEPRSFSMLTQSLFVGLLAMALLCGCNRGTTPAGAKSDAAADTSGTPNAKGDRDTQRALPKQDSNGDSPGKGDARVDPSTAKGADEERVKKALNLFETPVRVNASIALDPTHFDSKALFENAGQAKDKAEAEINKKGMGALIELADGMATLKVFYLDVFPNNAVSIAKVQEILGKEESAEADPKKNGRTWHKYAWLQLGVELGEVQVIRAYRKAPLK